jgi:ribose transport system ATP-binding protein
MRISDRITVFFEGTVARTLTRENFDKNRLLKLIVGREYNNRYPKIPMQKGYPVLSLQNVTTPNLRDINLTLFEGEILGVTGLIGSGKTCVGRALVGIDAITGGELKLGHRTVTNTSAYKMLTLGLTYIEAGGVKNLIPDFNAEKNITLANLASVSRFRFIRPKLEDITKNYYFKRLAIAQHHRTLPVKHYSGGTKKKIAISKALYSNSHILVLDEPTAGMDSSSKSDLYNFMNDFISKGNSILLISSDFSEVAGMSDRVIIMSGGAIVKQLGREGNLREDIIHYSTFAV